MIDEHGEEEDEKTKRDLEILKKYHKKETKSVKKIFITLFFNICIGLHSEITYGVKIPVAGRRSLISLCPDLF